MILELEAKQFALLHDVRVRFGPGLNVLTGETGAGKSLLIDALEFLLGHEGPQGASVQGIFRAGKAAADYLRGEGFEIDGGELYLSRESRAGGKTVSRINGTFVPAAKIRALAPHLIEVHGQHAYHSLFDPKTHLLLLDAFAGPDAVNARGAAERAYKAFRDLRNRLRELAGLENERARRLDLCRYELDEIEKAKLTDGEEESLRGERDKLSQTAKLQQSLRELETLAERAEFHKLIPHLEKLAPFQKKLEPWVSRLSEMEYEWMDLKQLLAACRDDFLPDPGRLEAIVERLDEIQKLKKKYGSTIAEILAYAAGRKAELDSLESVEENLKETEREAARAEAELAAACDRLSSLRKKAVAPLKEKMEEEFRALALSGGKFETAVETTDEASATGREKIEFLVALNPGEPPSPLEKTASGGELSRVMLALRSVLASERDNDDSAALVFDEIDAGIGGETAFHVAERLRALSAERQVLCVTHLHQVASAADQHFRADKEVDAGKTFASLTKLEAEEKVAELARMMGGSRATDALVAHARELLASSQSKKPPRGAS